MRRVWRHFLTGGFIFCTTFLRALAIPDPCLVLGTPVWTNGQTHFTLLGEAHVPYVIERSSDLTQWTPVLTNSSPAALRSMVLESPETDGYFRASRAPLPRFAFVILANEWIDLNGQNVFVDSFDSADPNYSTNGIYDPAKAKANASVAARKGITNSFEAGDAIIKGVVVTGPEAPLMIGSSGAVGGTDWVDNGMTGIQPGHREQNMGICSAPVSAPPGPYFSTSSGWVFHDGMWEQYNAVLGNGRYWIGNWGTGNYRVYVMGDAILFVTGNINLTGLDTLHIAPGASLIIYAAGSTTKFSGFHRNENDNPSSFQYYGLRSNTSLIIARNAPYVGLIYAPSANVTLGGGGIDVYDFVGACTANSVRLDGKFRFHFDENLMRTGPTR